MPKNNELIDKALKILMSSSMLTNCQEKSYKLKRIKKNSLINRAIKIYKSKGFVLLGGRTPLYLTQKDAYMEKEMKIISEIKKNSRLLKAVLLSTNSINFFLVLINYLLYQNSQYFFRKYISICLKY